MKESTLKQNKSNKIDNLEVTLSCVAFLIIWQVVALIINNDIYHYDEINLWEDNGLMFRIFYYSNIVSSINESSYHYNQQMLDIILS